MGVPEEEGDPPKQFITQRKSATALVLTNKPSLTGAPKFRRDSRSMPVFSKPNFYIFNAGIRMVAAGVDFCLALDNSGVLLSWGENCSALG